jgi:ATP-dependent dihydroxyacetone kinase
MKKLINDPRAIVRQMLEGAVLTAPGHALLADENVVLRADLPANPMARQVAVISGGGSGHEPAHAGYVGEGMLSAAVVGDVFTSPSVDAVLAAIRAVSGPSGAVLIVKNYTGDRLNFGLAAELATHEGIPTEVVVVADDVALRNTVTRERRRGIAGTVLVHKIAGAAAASGAPRREVVARAWAAAGAVGTMGVGLAACTVPAAGKPSFELADDEIEFGLGIHGEKGVRRGPMASADEIVRTIVETLLDELQPAVETKLALLVNGLGATPPMELSIVARAALALLRDRGLVPVRAYVGNYMTALEMAGCSISLLVVDDRQLAGLDAATTAPAWTASGRVADQVTLIPSPANEAPQLKTLPDGELSPTLRAVAAAVADRLLAVEARLSDLDAKTGDGDLGASMVRGAEAVMALPPQSFATPSTLLSGLGNALRRAIAGSSGPFYATALLRAAKQLDGVPVPSERQWLEAFAAATASVGEIGGAKPGDRTMLDALAPAIAAWREGDWAAAVAAAEAGAEATAGMLPRLGRASYLGERALGVPDGGAVAVSIWMRAIADALAKAKL